MALVFDIETVGENFDDLDETTQQNLTRWVTREAGNDVGKRQAMVQDIKENLGFSPLTGQIVALGVYDTIRDKGVVYYQGQKEEKEKIAGKFIYRLATEAEMLQKFWQGAVSYQDFVSFNGRAFDVPFMLLRSAVHRIKATRNLMGYRYTEKQNFGVRHIDLLDQLSFYGAVRRKGSLHLYCRALGIKSPKTEGISGDDVSNLFKAGRFQEIAVYNSWDLQATAELYKIWQDYIKN